MTDFFERLNLSSQQQQQFLSYPKVIQERSLKRLQYKMTTKPESVTNAAALLLKIASDNLQQAGSKQPYDPMTANAGVLLGEEAPAYEEKKKTDKPKILSQEELAAKYGAPGNHIPDKDYFHWLVSRYGYHYMKKYGYDNKSGIRPDFAATASAAYRYYYLKARHEKDMKDFESGLIVLGPVRRYPQLPKQKL